MPTIALVPYKVVVKERVRGGRYQVVPNDEMYDTNRNRYSFLQILGNIVGRYPIVFSQGKNVVHPYVDQERSRIICFDQSATSSDPHTVSFVAWYGEYGVARQEIPVAGTPVPQMIGSSVAVAYPFPARYFFSKTFPSYGLLIIQKYSNLGIVSILRDLIREELKANGISEYVVDIEPILFKRTLDAIAERGERIVNVRIIGDYIPRRTQDWEIADNGDLRATHDEKLRSEFSIKPPYGGDLATFLRSGFDAIMNWVRTQSRVPLAEEIGVFVPKALKLIVVGENRRKTTITINLDAELGRVYESLVLDDVINEDGTLNFDIVFGAMDNYYSDVMYSLERGAAE